MQLETLQDVVAAVDDLKGWLDDVHSWLETQQPGQAIGEGITVIEMMMDNLKASPSSLQNKEITRSCPVLNREQQLMQESNP